MKTYQDCKKIALENLEGTNVQPNIAYDYGNAYLFSKKNYKAIGGALPIVVLKKDGKAVTMSTYVNMYDTGAKEKEIDYETGNEI